MCNYKTLFKNEHGYVVKCNHCLQLHVAFGTTLLAFSEDQFFEFSKMVTESYNTYQFVCCRKEKRVQLPTAIGSVMLVFSINELDQFRDLLQNGGEVLRHDQLFQFNNN